MRSRTFFAFSLFFGLLAAMCVPSPGQSAFPQRSLDRAQILVWMAFLIGSAYQQGLGVPRSLSDSLSWFKKAAALGDAKCQTELGFIYANAVGVSRDYTEAARWYRLSAEQGDAAGAYGLGVRYMQGQGVSRDLAEAERWFKCAAAQGHGDAAYNLGVMYNTQAAEQNNPTASVVAAKYLRLAADQGISDAQCLLGRLTAAGTGTPKDNVAAFQCMTLALQSGTPQCSREINSVATNMTADQIAEGKRRAAVWRPAPHPGFSY